MDKPDKPRQPSKPRKSRKLAKPTPSPTPTPAFTPIQLRQRRDGWTAEKQVDFIEALAESGCVIEACRRVGMGRASAYALLTRNDSILFRAAWDAAVDVGIGALGDAARSRAINGVSNPIFYKGEQVGERVQYDERLTMFLLKTRDPERYGRGATASCSARPTRPRPSASPRCPNSPSCSRSRMKPG